MKRAALPKVRVGTENLKPDLAMSSGAIEHGVFPLVQALNGLNGVTTIASCHGHYWKARLWQPAQAEVPYVLFQAPMKFSQALATFIGLGRGTDHCLHYVWSLHAYFYPSTYEDLAWGLKIADARIPSKWNRDLIDADLSTMATIVSSVGISSVGLDMAQDRRHEETINA